MLITGLNGQGLVSEKADLGGTYARIGQPFINNFTSYSQIRLGGDRIETKIGGAFSGSLNKRLIINAENSDVNIGGPYSFYNTALAITAPDNALDLHLHSHGRITSQGGFTFHLDDNGGGFESFIVKGSSFLDNRFYIHEVGNHYVKGDLVVSGSVTNNRVDTLYKVIQNVDFEISGDPGDELALGYSFARADGDGSLTPSNQHITAGFNLPKGSVINEISFLYLDNDDENHLTINLILCGGAINEKRINIPHGNPENFFSIFPNLVTVNLNEVIDQQCINYIEASDHYEPVWFGNHWTGLELYPIRIKYTKQ